MSKIKLTAILFSILSISLSTLTFAEGETGWQAQRQEIKKQFDADGDGQLNKTERQAAKESFKQKRKEYMDKDGDGEISEAERTAMKEERKARILEKFDVDPQRSAMFEDLSRNLEPAKQSGMVTVLITPKEESKTAIEAWEHGHDDHEHIDHRTDDIELFLRGVLDVV